MGACASAEEAARSEKGRREEAYRVTKACMPAEKPPPPSATEPARGRSLDAANGTPRQQQHEQTAMALQQPHAPASPAPTPRPPPSASPTPLMTSTCADRRSSDRFGEITSLCRIVSRVQLCMVSLLQADTPWILPADSSASSAPFCDTPFCAWTLRQPGTTPLVVHDTMRDERFSGSPHVTGPPGIRFFAGVPLVATDGSQLGALCVLDNKPLELAATAMFMPMVANFANMATMSLEKERQLAAQESAAVALNAERSKLLKLMDVVGAGEAVLLCEVPLAAAASGGGSSSAASNATAPGDDWKIVCVNEAWETSTGMSSERTSNTRFWSWFRAPGDEAAMNRMRASCLRAAAVQQNFSATLLLSLTPSPVTAATPSAAAAAAPTSGAFASPVVLSPQPSAAHHERGVSQPVPKLLRLLFRCADRSLANSADSNALAATSSGVAAGGGGGGGSSSGDGTSSGAVAATPTCYYYVSIPNAAMGSGRKSGRDSGQLSGALIDAGHPSGSNLQPIMDSLHNVSPDLHIDALLGHGSFGRVYSGTYNGAQVAVKVLEHVDAASGVHLESLLTSQISHPNVVRTYTHCTRPLPMAKAANDNDEDGPVFDGPDGGPDGPARQPLMETFMVLEFCNAGTLSDAVELGWFRSGGRSSDGVVSGHATAYAGASAEPDMACLLATAREVASAMAYLHSLDILHGDLTGSNILLCSSDKDERGFVAKVADFGLSRVLATDDVRTKTYGAVSHTPPELLLTGLLSKAVDVYAFGVILWEVYMGEPPYKGLSQAQVINHISNGRGLSLHSDCPSGLRKLVGRCLSAKHEQRPTFAAILDEIEEMQEELM